MKYLTQAAVAVVLLAALPAAAGASELIDEKTTGSIAWERDLPQAFERAAREKKILMICINARRVEGGREEPAAKGLRDVIYTDPSVVEKSGEFVCVLLTSEGSSKDYGELKVRFGVEGLIVSPQHIFAAPDHKEGAAPLLRKEYWPYGKGDSGVKALLGMMDKALATRAAPEGAPGEGEATPAPAAPEHLPPPANDEGAGNAERAKWIQFTLALARSTTMVKRRAAAAALVKHDRDGDCLTPLLALLPKYEKKKDLDRLVDIVHELGVPELSVALEPLHDLLKHKDERVRRYVAVSLEFIGSKESVSVLTKRVKREKEPAVANHMYRALGRCGAGDAKVKKLLFKNTQGGKSHFDAYGPVIGLAYFEGDAKLARALEKQLKKFGKAFSGGRGGGAFMRAILIWCLSEIGDPKTEPWFRKEHIEPLEKVDSEYVEEVYKYYEAVAKKCAGDESEEVQAAITHGMEWYLRWGRSARDLRDEARKDRNTDLFQPKGEWERAEDD